MKFKTLFLPFCFFFFILILPVRAQKGLLWEISGNGLQKPSYLFGTIHLIPADDYFLPEGTKEALSSSGKVVFEMDISDPTLQIKLLSAMVMDSGKTLKSLYTPSRYRFIEKTLEKKYGLSLETFATTKPILIQQSLLVRKISGGDLKSYEKEFMAMAKEQSKPIGGLETLEDQISALSAMPLEKQAEALLRSLKKPGEFDKMLRKTVRLYREQDIDGLLKSVSENKSGFSDYQDALLDNRNRNWIAPMRTMMEEGPVFFAVGAAHLGGPNGIIALLRAEGFTVRPL